jgi:hypothetical protein
MFFSGCGTKMIARSAYSIVDVRFSIFDVAIQIVAGSWAVARSAYSIADVRFAIVDAAIQIVAGSWAVARSAYSIVVFRKNIRERSPSRIPELQMWLLRIFSNYSISVRN